MEGWARSGGATTTSGSGHRRPRFGETQQGSWCTYLIGHGSQDRGYLLDSARRQAVDWVRADVERLWQDVATPDTLASIDAFYLVERQRGLNRIASAADLLNPAYVPFGAASFMECALRHLGPQNRDESLHRAIIERNGARLAALPVAGGGDARARKGMARDERFCFSRCGTLRGGPSASVVGRCWGGLLCAARYGSAVRRGDRARRRASTRIGSGRTTVPFYTTALLRSCWRRPPNGNRFRARWAI